MTEVVNVEQQQAQRAVHALHPVTLAKQHGKESFAVEDSGQVIDLRVQQLRFAQCFKFAHVAPVAQQHRQVARRVLGPHRGQEPFDIHARVHALKAGVEQRQRKGRVVGDGVQRSFKREHNFNLCAVSNERRFERGQQGWVRRREQEGGRHWSGHAEHPLLAYILGDTSAQIRNSLGDGRRFLRHSE